jgi:hypothetical protein
MIAIEFDAQVTNGQIEIPNQHRSQLQGTVHVVVFPQSETKGTNKIDELLRQPIQMPTFQPLTRDQAHGPG